MKRIGAFEAKTRLGQLLNLVEAGEEVVITRHGKPVAKLVPAQVGHDRPKARRVADQLIEAGRGVTLGGLKIKNLINEGRR